MATGSPATWWEWRGSILKRELKLLHHCQTCSWGAAVGKSSRTNRRLCGVTSCRCYEWAAERWWWVTSFRQRTMGNVSSAPRHRLTVEQVWRHWTDSTGHTIDRRNSSTAGHGPILNYRWMFVQLIDWYDDNLQDLVWYLVWRSNKTSQYERTQWWFLVLSTQISIYLFIFDRKSIGFSSSTSFFWIKTCGWTWTHRSVWLGLRWWHAGGGSSGEPDRPANDSIQKHTKKNWAEKSVKSITRHIYHCNRTTHTHTQKKSPRVVHKWWVEEGLFHHVCAHRHTHLLQGVF